MALLTRRLVNRLFIETTLAKSTDQLWMLLEKFCEGFGLKHSRISIYDLDAEIGPETMLHLRTYPEGPDTWGEHYLREGLYKHDQSFQLLYQLNVEALEWQEMADRTRVGSEANRVFVEMKDYGIGNGILVGKSSEMLNKTALFAIAGPSKVFRRFTKDHHRALVQIMHIFTNCYLELAMKNGELQGPEQPDVIKLSSREREILKEISKGLSSKEAASELRISENYVNKTIRDLKIKTEIGNREGLVGYAMRTRQIQ